MNDIKLGDYAKDTVTELTGTVVAVTEWLHGCKRYTLQPKMDKTGKVPESMSFDSPQVVLVKAKSVNRKTKTGGFKPNLTRNYKI